MKKAEIMETITEIISEITNISKERVDPKASFMDDYNLDSLRALEILAAVENEYNIIINPEKLVEMTTLENVVEIAVDAMKTAGIEVEESVYADRL
jgi:acyl carrier protein